MQERIGQLCGQFKLPTMGAQSVARFTAAGHGDALATFLEVLEQEAEDRRPDAQPAAPGVPAALGQDLGNPSTTESPWLHCSGASELGVFQDLPTRFSGSLGHFGSHIGIIAALWN